MSFLEAQCDNGCGVNDGIRRDTGVCGIKNNGGGFEPSR
jgi:hypothetical protein